LDGPSIQRGGSIAQFDQSVLVTSNPWHTWIESTRYYGIHVYPVLISHASGFIHGLDFLYDADIPSADHALRRLLFLEHGFASSSRNLQWTTDAEDK
jgi:hypothetical protein